jgi:hypothetical protein
MQIIFQFMFMQTQILNIMSPDELPSTSILLAEMVCTKSWWQASLAYMTPLIFITPQLIMLFIDTDTHWIVCLHISCFSIQFFWNHRDGLHSRNSFASQSRFHWCHLLISINIPDLLKIDCSNFRSSTQSETRWSSLLPSFWQPCLWVRIGKLHQVNCLRTHVQPRGPYMVNL